LSNDGQKGVKKNELKPFQKKQWVIPSEKSASFVYQMEQVLSVYERPYDANFPVVCMDESPKQVIDYKEFIGKDGNQYQDCEYIRKGVVELFVATEPLAGFRQLTVGDDRSGGPSQIFHLGFIHRKPDGHYLQRCYQSYLGDG